VDTVAITKRSRIKYGERSRRGPHVRRSRRRAGPRHAQRSEQAGPYRTVSWRGNPKRLQGRADEKSPTYTPPTFVRVTPA
jgi:hypothetical protein